MMNKYGLSRTIDPAIKRQIRQECGFGCVVCGSAISVYHHFDPEFSEATEHDPQKIALLCGTCHDKVHRGIWSKEKIKKARLYPYCKRLGCSHFELDTSASKEFVVKVGKTEFLNLQSIIIIEDVKILSLAPPDPESKQFKISATFFDRNNVEVAKIIENEWQGTLSAFDIETSGNSIKVRSDLRKIDLMVKLEPPNALIIESLNFSFKGVQIHGNSTKGFLVQSGGSILKLPEEPLKIEKAPFWLSISGDKINLGSDKAIKFLRENTGRLENLPGYTTVQRAKVKFVDPQAVGIPFPPGVKPPEKMMHVRAQEGGGITINFAIPQANKNKNLKVNVGRNAPCPCGSGKKYKRCHGMN